jgi:hypothetical protein
VPALGVGWHRGLPGHKQGVSSLTSCPSQLVTIAELDTPSVP